MVQQQQQQKLKLNNFVLNYSTSIIVAITGKLEKPSRSVLLWLHATTHNQTLNLLFHH